MDKYSWIKKGCTDYWSNNVRPSRRDLSDRWVSSICISIKNIYHIVENKKTIVLWLYVYILIFSSGVKGLTIDPKKDIIGQLTSYNDNDSKEKSIVDDIWFTPCETYITCVYYGWNFYRSVPFASKNRFDTMNTIADSKYPYRRFETVCDCQYHTVSRNTIFTKNICVAKTITWILSAFLQGMVLVVYWDDILGAVWGRISFCTRYF